MTHPQQPFILKETNKAKQLPIIISIPHAGIDFPTQTASQIKPEFLRHPVDTDWFVHRLYQFAESMGITVIQAQYSRYVIDLNRAPQNTPLYSNARFQTSLVPLQTFSKQNIYLDFPPSKAEIESRLQKYYWPYYRKISALLDALRQDFAHVLLFDAHSIKRYVPAISSDKFPSFILGNQNGQTADKSIIDCALQALKKDDQYTVSHNMPFKGGHITRHFSNPQNGIHALQLEMSQDIYMNEETTKFQEHKANAVIQILQPMFLALGQKLKELNQ